MFTKTVRVQELCERQDGRPGLFVDVPNSPYGLCGRKATFDVDGNLHGRWEWVNRMQGLGGLGCKGRGGWGWVRMQG